MNKTAGVSTHSNGKPRAIRNGPWRLKCHAFEHLCVEISCSVEPSELSGSTCFGLHLESPQHCESLAAWLVQAAKFYRDKRNKKTSTHKR